MKKLILFTVSLFLLSMIFISAQAQDQKTSQFGIKAGLNLSNLYTSDAKSSDMLVGFNVGIFDKMSLSNDLAIQPELYVTTKGASVTYSNLLINGTAKFNLTYLELPVLLMVKVSDLVNIQFGPYIGYLLDGKVTNEANVSLFNFEQNINVNNYNRIDAGVVVGAGLDLGAISLGARFNLGLTKVGKSQSLLGATYNVPDATNGVINFYVGLAL